MAHFVTEETNPKITALANPGPELWPLDPSLSHFFFHNICLGSFHIEKTKKHNSVSLYHSRTPAHLEEPVAEFWQVRMVTMEDLSNEWSLGCLECLMNIV